MVVKANMKNTHQGEGANMATIKDIAEKAQVSPAAVSRILNKDATLSVSIEKRQKVIEIAKELGYKKTVKTNKAAFKLGILQWFSLEDELKDNYYLEIRKGIEDFCVKNCIHISRGFKTDINYMEQFKEVDGLICIGKFSENEIKKLMKVTENIVFLDMPISDYSVTTFTLDFKDAVTQVMEHFISLNHKRIGFLGGVEYTGNILFEDERKKYFCEYCERQGIEYKQYIKEGEYTIESGYEMMQQILKENNIPTAVFAASDNIAFGAMKAIKEQGLEIPKDISIIGFDDTAICSFTTPELTTIYAPAYEMGQYGVNVLFAASNLSKAVPMKVKMACKLIKRKSCMEYKK